MLSSFSPLCNRLKPCSLHNVPYNAFEKYLKLRRHFSDVHHITVTDLPPEEQLPREQTSPSDTTLPTMDPPSETTSAHVEKNRVRIMISIRMTNGIQISKKNMDYRELHSLVKKLEVLC